MNSHLNIFKTYTNSQRSFQLENDLTRAFAISLQEDLLFFNEILKEVFDGTKFYSQLFDSLENETTISVDIQKRTSQISDYEHIFAITLSEAKIGNFWGAKNNRNYDPICDLVIKINHIYLIIEAKRDKCDCTAQLYNQVLNVINSEEKNIHLLNKSEHGEIITPFDLNWSKLMAIAVKVLSFEKSFGNTNRFLLDFVSLVKIHNFRWLPEVPVSSLQSSSKSSILRRIDSAIIEASKFDRNNINKLHYKDRLGIVFTDSWAQEILFDVNKDGDLIVAIYPGNTKAQGENIFKTDPVFNEKIQVSNVEYPISKNYHIKFTSFQRYFTGLLFKDDDLKKPLYTRNNFRKYTGRKKKGADWDEIEKLFNDSLNIDWKEECKWTEKIINSGKSQFDISFGYEIVLKIPFDKLKELDTERSNLDKLISLIEEINKEFSENLLKTST